MSTRLSGKAGDVYIGLQVIHNCEAVWDEVDDADVAEALDPTDVKVGSNSMKFVCVAGLADGDIIGSDVVTSMDLTGYTHIMMWAKHSLGCAAADIQLLLDEDASCATPTKVDLPVLAAATWKLCIIAEAFTGLDAVISVGLEQNDNDPGAYDLWVDHICAAKIIAGIKSWTIDLEYDALDTTAFDSSGVKAFLPSLTGWKGTFEGYKTGAPLTIGSVVHLHLGESATLTQGFTGSAIITGLHPVGEFAGLVVYAYDFQGTHEVAIPTT